MADEITELLAAVEDVVLAISRVETGLEYTTTGDDENSTPSEVEDLVELEVFDGCEGLEFVGFE